jgi:hypothetical protein
LSISDILAGLWSAAHLAPRPEPAPFAAVHLVNRAAANHYEDAPLAEASTAQISGAAYDNRTGSSARYLAFCSRLEAAGNMRYLTQGGRVAGNSWSQASEAWIRMS